MSSVPQQPPSPANLRIPEGSRSGANTGFNAPCGGKRGFKGAYQNKGCKRWFSQVSINSTPIALGTFESAEEAARARDRAVLMSRGKGADTNFPLADYLDAQGKIREDPDIRRRLDEKLGSGVKALGPADKALRWVHVIS